MKQSTSRGKKWLHSIICPCISLLLNSRHWHPVTAFRGGPHVYIHVTEEALEAWRENYLPKITESVQNKSQCRFASLGLKPHSFIHSSFRKHYQVPSVCRHCAKHWVQQKFARWRKGRLSRMREQHVQIPGVMRTAGAFRDPKCGPVTKQRKEGTVGGGR